MSKYTSIDLFAGPGGLCTGFKWSGIKPLIAVEWSHWTVETYAKTHDADILDLKEYLKDETQYKNIFKNTDKTVIIRGDITKVSSNLILKLLKSRYGLNTVDIVTGGAPCESFSMAGDRKQDDERNNLFLNILRIARDVESKMILFENVKGLFSKKLKNEKGKMFEVICDKFEDKSKKIKYTLASRDKKTILLKASDYGVPQNRERLFLVAINDKYKTEFKYPFPTHGPKTNRPHVTVDDAISDLPSINSGETQTNYKFKLNAKKVSKNQNDFLSIMRGKTLPVSKNNSFNENEITFHTAVNHRENIIKRMSLIRQGENMMSCTKRLENEGRLNENRKYFPNKLYSARNRRLKGNAPSFTVTSHCLDEMIHPHKDRALTPREVARLQSFPDWYVIQGPMVKFHSDPEQDKYEQIGDAIPVLLAYNIGIEIVKALDKIKK